MVMIMIMTMTTATMMMMALMKLVVIIMALKIAPFSLTCKPNKQSMGKVLSEYYSPLFKIQSANPS